MNLNRWVWPMVLLVSSAGIGLMAYSGWQSPIRVWMTLWFTIICPGMALQRLVGLRLPISGWSLAIAFSLAIDTIVGIVLLYTGNWSWEVGLAILIFITVACTIFDLFLNRPKEFSPAIRVVSVPAWTKKSATKIKSE